jgi:F-type H+-transporting ATPase subunit gamma
VANLKEIRGRISSVSSTQQITKAMKLVSATKLRRAQGAIIQMRPYATKLKSILVNLSGSIDDPALANYFISRNPKKVLLVVITSDRGLCGAFNANVIKKTRVLLTERYAEQAANGDVTIMAIGKKGAEFFSKTRHTVDTRFREAFQNLNSETVFNIANDILASYSSGKYDVVELVFNQFKNAATQILTADQFLPVDIASFETSGSKQANDYIFEPGKVEILSELIPRSLKTQLYRALLDSFASEHGARMVAMEKATENAGELIKSLKLTYNQARQAAITNEISEIVGGAAALKG